MSGRRSDVYKRQMIGTQHNKISQPDLFKSCRRFTPCAKENQMEAIIAARPINKPNTDPPADPLAAPKINVPTPSAHAILETIPPIMPDRKYSCLLYTSTPDRFRTSSG